MKATDRPEFDTSDRRRIYEYIERNGAVRPVELSDADIVRVSPDRFHQLVDILKRNGYLEERDGLLRVALDGGATEEFARETLEFEIRPARQEDFPDVVGVIQSVTAERTHIEAETVAEELDREAALIRHNDLESRMFFVATVDAEVVGWCHVESPEVAKLRHTAELTLGIESDHRRRGIGSHLLHRGLSWAAAHGYEKVHQSLPATNGAAIEFLQSYEWTEEARRRGHYRVDGEDVDEVMMARYLTA